MDYCVTYFFTLPGDRAHHCETVRGADLGDCVAQFWGAYPTATLTAVDDSQLFDPDAWVWEED